MPDRRRSPLSSRSPFERKDTSSCSRVRSFSLFRFPSPFKSIADSRHHVHPFSSLPSGWVPAWTRLQPTTILIFLSLEQVRLFPSSAPAPALVFSISFLLELTSPSFLFYFATPAQERMGHLRQQLDLSFELDATDGKDSTDEARGLELPFFVRTRPFEPSNRRERNAEELLIVWTISALISSI